MFALIIHRIHKRAVRLLIGSAFVTWLVACTPVFFATPESRDANFIPAWSSISATLTHHPDVSVVEFTLSNSSHTAPADVLQEVVFWTGGGGGPGFSCETAEDKQFSYWPPSVITMDYMSILSCGWQSDAEVSFTLSYPNGNNQQTLVRAHSGEVTVHFMPLATDPTGTYSFQIRSVERTLSGSFEVNETPHARIDFVGQDILLHNFSPKEHVRLFAFKAEPSSADSCTLVGWQELTIGPKGSLLVQLEPPLNTDYYVTIGDVSGEVHSVTSGSGCGLILAHVTQRCPNAPNSRLSPGNSARVVSNLGNNLRVRSSAGINYDKVASLPEGTVMSIVDGPICAGKYVWWKVEVRNGPSGWVAEGDPGNYFIQPWQ